MSQPPMARCPKLQAITTLSARASTTFMAKVYIALAKLHWAGPTAHHVKSVLHHIKSAPAYPNMHQICTSGDGQAPMRSHQECHTLQSEFYDFGRHTMVSKDHF